MPEYISGIGLEGARGAGWPTQGTQESENPSQSFGDMLQEALQDVNQKQLEADEITEEFVAGETDDIHEMMIKTQEARLSLQTTVQVTNQIVQSYQELSRMQI